MLTELCKELRNWFIRSDSDMHFGVFTFSGGALTPSDFLQEGQYFRVVGSVFNDGVYKFGTDTTFTDETFEGAVWAMAVPKDVLALAEEIDDWTEKYGESVSGPYQSESFGGYSYSKGTTGSGSGSVNSWKGAFRDRLNRWRKI